MMTLLIFDVDGTLVQCDHQADSLCFAETYEQVYGRSFPTIEWSYYPHVTDTTIFQTVVQQHFARQATEAEVSAFQEIYIQRLQQNRLQTPEKFYEIPGAAALLHRLLADPNYVPAIATGGWQRPAHIKLQHVGIPSLSMPVSGADGKTTREDIIEAARRLACVIHPTFDKIVYIGDAAWDVHTTRNLNMDFVGIRRHDDIEMLTKLGATQVLSHFNDQEAFLEMVAQATPPGAPKIF